MKKYDNPVSKIKKDKKPVQNAAQSTHEICGLVDQQNRRVFDAMQDFLGDAAKQKLPDP